MALSQLMTRLRSFAHAESFYRALEILLQVPEKQLRGIVEAGLVLSAFASELYFKTLICIEAGRAPRSHQLYDLFLSLSSLNGGGAFASVNSHCYKLR